MYFTGYYNTFGLFHAFKEILLFLMTSNGFTFKKLTSGAR